MPIFQRLSFSVPTGAFVVLVGPSGAGKTTLLRLLAGLEQPEAGMIRMSGQMVVNTETGLFREPWQRNIGLCFQNYALWPHMTVAGNIDWPLKVARMPRAKRQQAVREMLSYLGLSELDKRYPGELSGGQQQRVAIGRMLIHKPSILLFDEPLSHLDADLRLDIRALIKRIHQESNATTVYVTHDLTEARALASHIVSLKAGKLELLKPDSESLNPSTYAEAAAYRPLPTN